MPRTSRRIFRRGTSCATATLLAGAILAAAPLGHASDLTEDERPPAMAVGAVAGDASGPDALPDALFWRREAALSLQLDPLQALSCPGGWTWESEWAPLYDGPRGERVRREQNTLRLVSEERPLRWGFEVDQSASVDRGGEEGWSVRSERPRSADATLAGSYRSDRAAAALAVGQSERSPGASFSARLRVARAITAGWSLSRWARSGRLRVLWDEDGVETEVDASGDWSEQRAEAGIQAVTPWGLAFEGGLSALDRAPRGGAEGDRLERRLLWRSSHATARARLSWARVSLGLDHGSGQEDLRVSRGGTAYAHAKGPREKTQLRLAFETVGGRLSVTLWKGSTRGDARGDVAMWPFDGALGLVGTRRVAWAEASLQHAGLAVDLLPGSAHTLDGGLAVWHLEPDARFSSWRASFFGLGREDQMSGASRVRDVIALGARGGARVRLAGASLRVEVIQWVPVRVLRTLGEGAPRTDGAASSGAPTQEGRGMAGWGGTILRVRLSAGTW